MFALQISQLHFVFIDRNKVYNCDTLTELSNKIFITGAYSIASFIDVNTTSSILTCNVGTGRINF